MITRWAYKLASRQKAGQHNKNTIKIEKQYPCALALAEAQGYCL